MPPNLHRVHRIIAAVNASISVPILMAFMNGSTTNEGVSIDFRPIQVGFTQVRNSACDLWSYTAEVHQIFTRFSSIISAVKADI